MRIITEIVIHCTASPNGHSLFHDGKTPVQHIDDWHMQRGFARLPEARAKFNPQLAAIGYHYIIYLGGAIGTGRGEEEIGAHARGHNRHSIGICLIGTDEFTLAQWAALKRLIVALKKPYPGAKIIGHNQISTEGKTCPGFSVPLWIANDMLPLGAHTWLDYVAPSPPSPPPAR